MDSEKKQPTKKKSTKEEPPKDDSCPHCGMRAGSEYFLDGQCICGYIVGMG